jgi:hypothetical protein
MWYNEANYLSLFSKDHPIAKGRQPYLSLFSLLQLNKYPTWKL